MNQEDFIGKKYGRLTILSFNEPKVYDYGYKMRTYSVNCICDCGNIHTTDFQALKRGKSKSCGCYGREWSKQNATTHGLSTVDGKKRPEYITWQSMKKRCLNLRNKDYPHYGGRGIKVCDRWLSSFENFFNDMGLRPEGHSIERIDVNGNYCPENCKWIPKTDQPKNIRHNQIEYKGKSQCLTEWSEEFNLPYNMLRHRIYDLKMTLEEAIIKPKLARNFPKLGSEVNGSKLNEEIVLEILLSTKTAKVLSETYKVNPGTIRDIRHGKTWKHVKLQ